MWIVVLVRCASLGRDETRRPSAHCHRNELSEAVFFAGDQPRADGFAEADVVGKKRDRQAAAKGDKVRDLMMVRLKMSLPQLFRLQVLTRFNDDGIGKVPFQRRAIEIVFVWNEVFAQILVWNSDKDANPCRTGCKPALRHGGPA
jgi:hypothetical protein